MSTTRATSVNHCTKIRGLCPMPGPVGRNVGPNKLAQFRQPYGKRTAAMPELRKLVPAYIFLHA